MRAVHSLSRRDWNLLTLVSSSLVHKVETPYGLAPDSQRTAVPLAFALLAFLLGKLGSHHMNNTRLASFLVALGAALALGACTKSNEATSTSAEPAATEEVTADGESNSVEVIPEGATEDSEAPAQ
jgi:hypothetical protein